MPEKKPHPEKPERPRRTKSAAGSPVKPATPAALPTSDGEPSTPPLVTLPTDAANPIALTEDQLKAATTAKPRPWLITAWPGMGNVAMITAVYLLEELDAEPFAELSSVGHFDVEKVDVKDGVVGSTRMPRSIFYRWKNPKGRDLIIFVGEAQPSANTYAFAHSLLEHATKLGVERVVTIASMASQLHPSAEPRVFGVATDNEALEELRRLEVKPLEDGQIGGLNGVMLGVAAERGVPGVCLLGEIPYFAAAVPNPKAAKSVMEVLCVLAGVEIDLAELTKHAATMDKAILELLKRLQEQQGEEGEEPGAFAPDDGDESEGHDGVSKAPDIPEPKHPDFATRSRIEEMFAEARKDRKRAVRLKEDLDRLGVFKLYENRFLDLFKRAG